MGADVFVRVDVDSSRGLAEGVPFYLDLFEELGWGATFCIPMGPNDLVPAAFRRLLDFGFWRQCWYMQPWKTHLGGGKHHPRDIGLGNPDMVREIERRGFEVALHGFDHALISNKAYEMSADRYREQLDKAVEAYVGILGHEPAGTASPAWRCSRTMLEVQDGMGFVYASDLFGKAPGYVEADGYVSSVPQIPCSTDPVFPLVVDNRGDKKAAFAELEAQLLASRQFASLLLHTEYDVIHCRDEVAGLLRLLKSKGVGGDSLVVASSGAQIDKRAFRSVVYRKYHGAFGLVAGC